MTIRPGASPLPDFPQGLLVCGATGIFFPLPKFIAQCLEWDILGGSVKFERHDMLEALFQRIFDYAADNSSFDTSFVDSVYEYFEKEGDISDKQYQALERITDKWGIE